MTLMVKQELAILRSLTAVCQAPYEFQGSFPQSAEELNILSCYTLCARPLVGDLLKQALCFERAVWLIWLIFTAAVTPGTSLPYLVVIIPHTHIWAHENITHVDAKNIRKAN